MAAASRRLDNVARNVANLQTAGYRPQRIVTKELPHGGVTTEAVPAELPEESWLDNPALDGGSHVDLAFEAVERISAAATFRANAAVIEAADEAEQSLLDILA
jgi:flagellar hook protein FlgE